LNHFARYNWRIGFCDLPLFELAGNDLLDLVFQAEGNFGDFNGGEGGADGFALRKDCRAFVQLGFPGGNVALTVIYLIAKTAGVFVSGGVEDVGPFYHPGSWRSSVGPRICDQIRQ